MAANSYANFNPLKKLPLTLTLFYPSHLNNHSLLHQFSTPESPIPTPMYTLWTNRSHHSYLTPFYFSQNYTLTHTRFYPQVSQKTPPLLQNFGIHGSPMYIHFNPSEQVTHSILQYFHPLDSPILTSLSSEELNPSLLNSSSLLDKPTLTPIYLLWTSHPVPLT